MELIETAGCSLLERARLPSRSVPPKRGEAAIVHTKYHVFWVFGAMKKVSKLITGVSCQETIADSVYILLLLMMLRDRLENCGLKLWSCQDTEEQVERGAISGCRTPYFPRHPNS